jgi:glycine cleavage system H protein
MERSPGERPPRGGIAMPEYLEVEADKFTFRVATDRRYSPEGVWVRPESSNRVRVGLSDFLQQRSGDLAFISVKDPGTRVQRGDELAEMETVKVTQGVPSPIAGTVLAVNDALERTPEVVNGDPYGEGWLALVEPASWDADRVGLLDARAYQSVVRSQIDAEVREP